MSTAKMFTHRLYFFPLLLGYRVIFLTLTLGHPNRPPKTSHRKVERLIYALV